MDLFPPESPRVNRACPDCGAGDVRPTLDTIAGAYCECEACGHLWHDERRKSTGDVRSGGRRRTDAPAV